MRLFEVKELADSILNLYRKSEVENEKEKNS